MRSWNQKSTGIDVSPKNPKSNRNAKVWFFRVQATSHWKICAHNCARIFDEIFTYFSLIFHLFFINPQVHRRPVEASVSEIGAIGPMPCLQPKMSSKITHFPLFFTLFSPSLAWSYLNNIKPFGDSSRKIDEKTVFFHKNFGNRSGPSSKKHQKIAIFGFFQQSWNFSPMVDKLGPTRKIANFAIFWFAPSLSTIGEKFQLRWKKWKNVIFWCFFELGPDRFPKFLWKNTVFSSIFPEKSSRVLWLFR